MISQTLRASRPLINTIGQRGLQSDITSKDVITCLGKTTTIGAALLGSALAAPETIGVCAAIGVGTFITSTTIVAPALSAVLNPSNRSYNTEDVKNFISDSIKKPSGGCIRAPIVEEVMCRFLLQDQILPPLIDLLTLPVSTPTLAIGITSLTFGSLHLLNGRSPLFKIQTINAAGMGSILGTLYNEYGLVPVIATHAVHNTLCNVHRCLHQILTKK